MAIGQFVISWPVLLTALRLPPDTTLVDAGIADINDALVEPDLVLTVAHRDIHQRKLEPVFASASDGTVQFVRWTREES